MKYSCKKEQGNINKKPLIKPIDLSGGLQEHFHEDKISRITDWEILQLSVSCLCACLKFSMLNVNCLKSLLNFIILALAYSNFFYIEKS